MLHNKTFIALIVGIIRIIIESVVKKFENLCSSFYNKCANEDRYSPNN